jgi:hypothetical protein
MPAGRAIWGTGGRIKREKSGLGTERIGRSSATWIGCRSLTSLGTRSLGSKLTGGLGKSSWDEGGPPKSSGRTASGLENVEETAGGECESNTEKT